MADARAPVGRTHDAPAPLRVRVSPAPAPVVAPSADIVAPVDVATRARASTAAAPWPARPVAPRASDAVATAAATAAPLETTATDTAVDRGPKPLTYPVLSLPPDDDPRRVGLVRLMLVVSSEGRVVKTVVTAATLSQDYVDRIAESFEAVRFEPATRAWAAARELVRSGRRLHVRSRARAAL